MRCNTKSCNTHFCASELLKKRVKTKKRTAAFSYLCNIFESQIPKTSRKTQQPTAATQFSPVFATALHWQGSYLSHIQFSRCNFLSVVSSCGIYRRWMLRKKGRNGLFGKRYRWKGNVVNPNGTERWPPPICFLAAGIGRSRVGTGNYPRNHNLAA